MNPELDATQEEALLIKRMITPATVEEIEAIDDGSARLTLVARQYREALRLGINVSS